MIWGHQDVANERSISLDSLLSWKLLSLSFCISLYGACFLPLVTPSICVSLSLFPSLPSVFFSLFPPSSIFFLYLWSFSSLCALEAQRWAQCIEVHQARVSLHHHSEPAHHLTQQETGHIAQYMDMYVHVFLPLSFSFVIMGKQRHACMAKQATCHHWRYWSRGAEGEAESPYMYQGEAKAIFYLCQKVKANGPCVCIPLIP